MKALFLLIIPCYLIQRCTPGLLHRKTRHTTRARYREYSEQSLKPPSYEVLRYGLNTQNIMAKCQHNHGSEGVLKAK